MKLAIALCLLAACYTDKENLGFSAIGSPRWAVSLGGRDEDRGLDIAFDSVGDVITAGDFHGPADFGSGLDNAGGPWAFITKRFASDGTEAWTAKLLGQSSASQSYIADLAIGPGNTVIVTGSYMGTVDFGGTTLTLAPDKSTVFVASYAADGHLLWVTDFDDFAQASALTVDQAGNIYVTGQFWRSTLTFNGHQFRESDNDMDTFLAAFDAQGSVLWGTAFQGAAPGTINGAGPVGSDIAITATGDVLVTGTFTGAVSFGGPVLQPDARIRSFVARYHANGSYVSSQVIGPPAPIASDPPRVAIDAAGRIVIQQNERDESMTGPQSYETQWPATLRVYDDTMHELWNTHLDNHGRLSPQPRTLATTHDGLIISSAWTDWSQNTHIFGAMEVVAYDAQGTAGTDRFGSRLDAPPEVTLAFDSAASSTGALGFTGALTGSVDFGTGALAARGQGDMDIFIVVVDPPTN